MSDNSFLKYHNVFDHLAELKSALIQLNREGKTRILDVGGADGAFLKSIIADCGDQLKANFVIEVLDLEIDGSSNPTDVLIRQGDICSAALKEHFTEKYDCIFTYNAMEHFHDPISAADNMCSLLRPGGHILCSTVFSWRFHPVPNDYFRYTDQALEYLFSKRNGLKLLKCGYDLSRRRENITGGYFADKDIPPGDYLGGFRENWIVTYIGCKPGS